VTLYLLRAKVVNL